MGWREFFFPKPRCPACGEPQLVPAQWIRATVIIVGKRAPAFWTYYRCAACEGRFREELGRPMVEATEEEWRHDVERK